MIAKIKYKTLEEHLKTVPAAACDNPVCFIKKKKEVILKRNQVLCNNCRHALIWTRARRGFTNLEVYKAVAIRN